MGLEIYSCRSTSNGISLKAKALDLSEICEKFSNLVDYMLKDVKKSCSCFSGKRACARPKIAAHFAIHKLF